MPEKLTLYVCHIDDGGPPAARLPARPGALRDAGHDFEKIVFAKGIPFGLFTKGRRPELKADQRPGAASRCSCCADGTTVNGSAKIIAWARANSPGAERAAQAPLRRRRSGGG